MSSHRRPEHEAPPEVYYNDAEAFKYTQNTRIMTIQHGMTERAIELLALTNSDNGSLILDMGCGSGLSGECIEEHGHLWVGLDISKSMLAVAVKRQVQGDLILSDLGQGIPFRAGLFDGAISISALQWLCNADKSYHKPVKRLFVFFTSLYAALRRGARAIFQFYPESSQQIDLITTQAIKAGFSGGVLVDYPNSTKAKKFFLVLLTGGGTIPKALSDNEVIANNKDEQIRYDVGRRWKTSRMTGKKSGKSWILDRKERRRRKGLETREDTKYTGRKRCGRF